MKKTKSKIKPILALVFICITFSLTSCLGLMVQGVAKNKFTENKGAIPPDFMKEESTLICVLQERNSYDKYLKKHMQAKYHGPIKFVLKSKLFDEGKISSKYKDTVKYRFIFNYGLGTQHYSDTKYGPGTGGASFSTKLFYVLDRKDGKKYNSPFSSSFFAKLIKAYAINLEKKRLE